MNKSYIAGSLINILNLLPGDWSIKKYELVHHGWICTIQNLDNWPKEPPIEIFLHSEEGRIDVSESNKVGSKIYGQGLKDPTAIVKTIEQNLK